MAQEKLAVYGEVDRDVRQRVASEYPAWYFVTHVNNMKEERDMLKRRIDRGEVPQDNIPQSIAEVKAMTERIELIEKSQPDLTDKEKENLFKLHQELSKKISDAMFSRSEMQMGTASPQEEARRMIDKTIGLSPPLRGLAKTCNVQMDNSKVSRNDATKMWKIIGRLLDVGTNVEGLRKDRATVQTGYTSAQMGA